MSDTGTGRQFLHLDDAARLLGVSRLVLREGIVKGLIEARRDNQGHYRIDLADVPADLLIQLPAADSAPTAMINALRDEVGAMQQQLNQAEQQRVQLEALLLRQSQALEKSATLLDQPQTPLASSSASGDVNRLGSVADRSMMLLEETTDALQKSRAENARLTALVERAFEVVEQTQQSSQRKVAELTESAERSLAALDKAVEETRISRQENERLSQLISRSMQVGARFDAEVTGRESVIEKQDSLLQRLFNLTERNIEQQDASQSGTRQRGFLSWWRNRGSGL